MTARKRWTARWWLIWFASLAPLYLVGLSSAAIGSAISGHPFDLGGFTAWYAVGLAVATVLVAVWQLGRSS
jgi:hypothetical protein